jgi:hypothetical protein
VKHAKAGAGKNTLITDELTRTFTKIYKLVQDIAEAVTLDLPPLEVVKTACRLMCKADGVALVDNWPELWMQFCQDIIGMLASLLDPTIPEGNLKVEAVCYYFGVSLDF